MALDNYTNLKQACIKWSHRHDSDEILDDCIDLVEEAVFSGAKPLRTRDFEVLLSSNMVAADRTLDLPTGFLELRSIYAYYGGNKVTLDYVTPDKLNKLQQSGMPRFYTITSEIVFDRLPDSTYSIEIDFYQRPEKLSTAEPTNLLLTKYPSIYLNGCLWKINEYAAEEEKASYYEQRFMQAIMGANKSDRKARYGTAPASTLQKTVA